jgi:hypothetical protein
VSITREVMKATGTYRDAACHWNDDAGAYLRWSITVLTLCGERIAEITSFLGPDHFAPFKPPASMS